NADIGDRVTLIGTDGLETLTADDVANAADTIPYEITCRLGSRVKRIYRDAPSAAEPQRDRKLES
ncbi:MAG: alanine racemase C-terminal domain-containing protein, partial [Planctomycetota bacterium]